MRVLRYADFSAQVGQGYEVLVNGGSLAVQLDEAQPLPGSQREGGGFRLLFSGPFEPQIVQGTYVFRNNGNADQIFVVPIARDERGTQYEALFV
jgi:hypothetical protein